MTTLWGCSLLPAPAACSCSCCLLLLPAAWWLLQPSAWPSRKLAAFTSLCLTLSACKSHPQEQSGAASSAACRMPHAACCKVVPLLMYAHITLPLTRLMSCIAMRRAPARGLSPQIGATKRAVITELPLPPATVAT